jgi:hydroxymethylpyrimidine pyrophosphatase-like HAD family hydrolase
VDLIKAVIVDLDGVLNSTALGQPLDLLALQKLQEINMRSLSDKTVPFITINTGRSLPYTEVFAQALAIDHFFIFEFGAALAKLQGAKILIKPNPKISREGLDSVRKFRDAFLTKNPQFEYFLQPGKAYMNTFIFDINRPERLDCAKELELFIRENKFEFRMDVGHNFINILFPKIDKGTAMEFFIKEESGLNCNNLGGIGDSDSDMQFLQHCGYRACPSNGSATLKSNCNYIAKKAEAQGTVDIIQEIIKSNRKLKSSN